MLLVIACLMANAKFASADPAEDTYLLAAGYYKKERFDLAAEQFQKFQLRVFSSACHRSISGTTRTRVTVCGYS